MINVKKKEILKYKETEYINGNYQNPHVEGIPTSFSLIYSLKKLSSYFYADICMF